MNPLQSSQNHEISQNLAPALIKCFGIIFIGYIFGRLQILPNDLSKGLRIYVQNLALPVLIFNLVATTSVDSVNWVFIGAVFVTKIAVFFVVALSCMILMRPVHIGKAGLYGTAAAQSNDFALGYPLLLSLYKDTHSNYASFLAFTGPIQVLAINPAGFIMLEMSKQTASESRSRWSSFFTIVRGTFSNPIVVMTIIGIIWNFCFDHTVPLALAQLIEAIGSSFSATALILLGHSMAGKISRFRGSFVLAPVLLIFAKNIVTPLVLQRMIVLFSHGSDDQDTQDLSSLGFLYGTIPCALAVFVFACQYDLSIDVIASTIIFSTLLSAPIMFATATMSILSVQDYENIAHYMESTIGYISLVSMISCLAVFLMGKTWCNRSYGATIYLVLAQLMLSVGGILCFFRNGGGQSILYTQYMISCAGIISTRIWTVCLAVLLFLSHWKNIRSVLKAKYVVNIIGYVGSFGISFLLAGILLISKTLTKNSDPNFPLGFSQICLTAVVTCLCFLMTVVFLTLHNKFAKMAEPSEPTDESAGNTTTDIERNSPPKNYRTFESNIGVDTCISENRDACNLLNPVCHGELSCNKCGFTNPKGNNYISRMRTGINSSDISTHQIICASSPVRSDEEEALNQNTSEQYVRQNTDSEETSRDFGHVLLLIILSLSMLVSFFVCFWKLSLENTNGVFVELEFLDLTLTYSQGFIYFLIFGFESTIVRPCVKLWCHIQCWRSSLPFLNRSS